MFKSIISAEVNTVWNEPQSNHEVIAGGAEVYIVYCNEFSHVVSYPYGTYLSTNNKTRDLSYVTLQWELWNFKNKPWHGVIVLFPRLNNCKFSENILISFKWQRNFAKCVKVSFVPLVKEELEKNCNLAKQITFKLEMALFQGTAGEGYFPIFFHLLNTQYRRSLKYVPAMATPLC